MPSASESSAIAIVGSAVRSVNNLELILLYESELANAVYHQSIIADEREIASSTQSGVREATAAVGRRVA